MARGKRRAWRAPSDDGQGMTQADLDAVKNYRANRGSARYYRDLKVIGEKSPSAQLDDTKK